MPDIFDQLGDIFDRVGGGSKGSASAAIEARRRKAPDTAMGDPNPAPPSGPLKKIYDQFAGEGKSFINTGYNIGKGVVNIAKNRPADSPIYPDFEAALVPQNQEEAVGKMLGDVSQFMLPAGAIGRIQKAVELGKMTPAAARIMLNALSRGALQGGQAGLTSLAQGGDFNAPALVAGGVGAVAPAVEQYAPAAAKWIGRRFLRAKPGQFIRGADPVAGLVENTGVARSQAKLAEQLDNARSVSGQAIQDQAAQIGGQFDPIAPLDEAADKAIKAARNAGKPTPSLEAFRQGRREQIAEGLGLPREKGQYLNEARVPATAIQNLKSDVYSGIDWGLNADAAQNALAKEYSSKLAEMVPLAENQNYANINEAGMALQQKIARDLAATGERTPITWGGVTRLGLAGGAGAHGYREGGVGRGLTEAGLAYLLGQMYKSTPVQTGLMQGFKTLGTQSGNLSPLFGYATSQATRPSDEEYLRQLMLARR